MSKVEIPREEWAQRFIARQIDCAGDDVRELAEASADEYWDGLVSGSRLGVAPGWTPEDAADEDMALWGSDDVGISP